MKKSLAVFLSWVALLWATGASGIDTNNAGPEPGGSKAQAAADFTPKFDITGSWSDGTDTASITRAGRQVKAVCNNAGYEHSFEGYYIDEKTVTGITMRKSRADGSVTRMAVTWVLDSAETGKGYWVALDSNSDLTEGQTATNTIKRVKAAAGPEAADFTPKFDINGIWNDGDDANATMTRTGKHVKIVFNNSGYEHTFEGDYTDGATITGVQMRKSKADGSTTRMAVTISLDSADTAKVKWEALDSNSDLEKGQTGDVDIKRVKAARFQFNVGYQF